MEGDEGAPGDGAPAAPPVVEVWARTLEEVLSGLRDNTVTHVTLIGHNIGDAGAMTIGAALEHNTSLQQLDLTYNQIGDGGAAGIGAALEHNTSLQQLCLDNNHIGEGGAAAFTAAFKHNTSLRKLSLYQNQIGDGGAAGIGAALVHNMSLQELHLSNNQIGDGGAAAFAGALQHNTSLQKLLLSENLIGDGGAVAFAAALKHNTSLQKLSLYQNQIGDGGAIEIAAALKHNTSLEVVDLADNYRIGLLGVSAFGDALKNSTSLRRLNLVSCLIGDDEVIPFLAALKHNTTLRHLQLGNTMGESGAEAIGEFLKLNTSLEELHVPFNSFGDGGSTKITAALKHNTSLRELYLDGTGIGDGGAIAIGAVLEKNTTLLSLSLTHNQIGDVGAAAIEVALKSNTSLRKLSLMDNQQIGDTCAAAFFACLKHNTALNALYLNFCPIHTLGTEFLLTRRLEECTLSFEKLVWPPSSLASQGRNAIYSFLEAVKEKSAPLARSRVMFVGAGGSGKTTLKTALLLQGAGACETLQQLQQSMVARIELLWAEADLQEWVDTDLARHSGFFSACPRARGLTGKRWLRLSASDVSRVFGHPDTFTSDEVVAKMTAVLRFLTLDPDNVAVRDEVPYGVLLNIPHVWTEGVELDTRWEEYTLWDFPGQMELYPSHRLFLACETAVYVLVVNGRTGEVAECMQQLHRWLSLIRSGFRDGGNKIGARVVVTHTDTLLPDHRSSLLRDIHQKVALDYAEYFDFGDRCYATCYNELHGGDVDAVRAELVRLQSVLPPNRPLPASYQAICDDVVRLARDNVRWPVAQITAIDWRGQTDEAMACLEDLGFLRRADGKMVLEPVTWLSTLMSAFLHPIHGIGTRRVPPLQQGATAAVLREHHIASVLVDHVTACQIVNRRDRVVDAEHESEVLPLLAHFDICFSPFDDGKYVFPSLLPRVISLPPWLARPFEAITEGRRFMCSRNHDFIPPTVASMLMQRAVALGRQFGGEPLFFGRGTVVVGCSGTTLITVHLSDDDRSLDIIANATDILGCAALYLMKVLVSSFPGTHLTKLRITRLPDDQFSNPLIKKACNHPLLGPCRVDPVTTAVLDSPSGSGGIAPEWLRDEYERTLPKVPYCDSRLFPTRAEYFVHFWKHTVGDRAHLLVDGHLVEETHVPVDVPSPADGPLVVVASCPHTMSLTNTEPFFPVDDVNVFDVFAHCEELQRAGRIRIAYDRKGTSNASARDVDVIWSLHDPRLGMMSDYEKWDTVKHSVSESAWFEDSFQSQIKTAIKMIAQSEPGREIRLVCIRGGPITEVEQEYMSKIVSDSHKDATIFGLANLRITIDIRNFCDFRDEFPL